MTAAALFMAGLGIVLAAVLALANRILYVHEDPRIDEVEDRLPHANCGACGFPGCRPFAEAVVSGEANPSGCTVNSQEMIQSIADFMGIAVGQQTRMVARLACAGGSHVARMKARYKGLATCRAAAVSGGGGKACAWGCLGLGDCVASCDFDAMFMDEHGLPQVIVDKCVACGDCVEACPLDLFSLQPIDHKLWVACKSLAEGDAALEDCEVACTGCARCAADAPEGLITMKNNLAVIDYTKNRLASKVAIERCPTGAIVWLEGEKIVKGAAAKRIVRKQPLPLKESI
jgi:Na+-translocating ferredoxin:NAD+ oxidoreductase RNF subunit RnfB